MADGIRIDALPPTIAASKEHVVPSMRDGITVKLSVGQINDLGRLATALESGTDFDDITSPGLYAVTSDVNAPLGGGRWLVACNTDPDDASSVFQTAMLLSGGMAALTFTRRSVAGVFGAWSGGLSAADISFDDSAAFPGATNVQEALEAAADPWASLPLRVPIPVFDHIPGVSPPPTDKAYRYVELTAGLTGSGGYNEGILANESVSGSAPYITATAEIDLPASPMHGQTIPLINTERRFIRAGTTSGVTQDDQIKQHNHTINGYVAQDGQQGPRVASGPGNGGITSPTTNATGGDETRPRNISVTYYMRIL